MRLFVAFVENWSKPEKEVPVEFLEIFTGNLTWLPDHFFAARSIRVAKVLLPNTWSTRKGRNLSCVVVNYVIASFLFLASLPHGDILLLFVVLFQNVLNLYYIPRTINPLLFLSCDNGLCLAFCPQTTFYI